MQILSLEYVKYFTQNICRGTEYMLVFLVQSSHVYSFWIQIFFWIQF